MKIHLIVSETQGNYGCDGLEPLMDIIDGEKSILKVIKFFFVKKKNHASYIEDVCVQWLNVESVLVSESRIIFLSDLNTQMSAGTAYLVPNWEEIVEKLKVLAEKVSKMQLMDGNSSLKLW